jgi:hypothetical protein
MLAGFQAARVLRRMVLPALASVVFFVSCQQLAQSDRAANPSVDSVRVVLSLGAGSDTLPEEARQRAKWLRVQFATARTGAGLVIDTIVPLTPADFVSPAFPRTCGYSATLTGLDADFRKAWGGGATRRAVGPATKDADLDTLCVPTLVTAVLKSDSASLPSGAIDFPRLARLPARLAPGTRRVCSVDGRAWTDCPTRLRIDSAMSLEVQVQSLDSLTGAPHSPVVRQTWTAKPVAPPVWRLKRHKDLPGKPWRATLRSATRGAKIEWSADSGKTWNPYRGRFRIRPGKLYVARAIKKHQGESPLVELSWKRSGRVLKASQFHAASTAGVQRASEPAKVPPPQAVDSSQPASGAAPVPSSAGP